MSIDRIRDEMAENEKDTLIQMIGDHISAYLEEHPRQMIIEGATLRKAADAMQKEAAKKRNGRNWAALDFLTGMEIAYGVLGLAFDATECTRIQMSLYDGGTVMPEKKTQAPAEADAFDLDRMLAGL